MQVNIHLVICRECMGAIKIIHGQIHVPRLLDFFYFSLVQP